MPCTRARRPCPRQVFGWVDGWVGVKEFEEGASSMD